MGTLRVLLPWLALLHLQAPSVSSRAKPGCLGTCGDIEVPYPFGLSLTCSLGIGFNLTCDESVFPHKLMWGGIQVINFNVERGEMTISLPISYGCYTGGQITNQRAYYYINLIEHSTFTFSIENRFTTIGCDTLGLFTGSWGKNFTGGCATYCKDPSKLDVDSSSCDGVGCCQTSIPKGVRQANFTISSFDNYANLANDLNCGYAFLVNKDNFTFHPDVDLKANSLLQSRTSFPVLVDWAIGGQDDTCKTLIAQNGTGRSGCLAEHSECINSTAGYGYRCNCTKGYYGNPYLENDGCQDINECESPYPNNCAPNATCFNTDGGYRCQCPTGWEGNGTKGGKECKPPAPPVQHIPVAYKAVAACVSLMFLLLGVGRLFFRYKLMPKWVTKNMQPVINVIKPKCLSNDKERGTNSISEPNSSSSKGEEDMRRNAKKRYPVVEKEYLQAAKKCKKRLRTLIYYYRCAPIMLYLAWYDVNEKNGKPFGTITHQFAHEDVEKAKKLLEEIARKESPVKISKADIYQLAGVVAVELVSGTDVAFHPGRDHDDTQNMPPHHIGTHDHDIVAISPWLRRNEDCSGLQFIWPPTFDMKSLPDDHYLALCVDNEFSIFEKKNENHEDSFLADYAKSHLKLSELGFADAD